VSTAVNLRGRSAIVTGAGKGLGRAYALHLAACGAQVLVNNRRHPGEADDQTSAARTVAAIRAGGGSAEANWDDVGDPSSGPAMVQQAIACFGGLDIVVANAGVDKPTAFHKQDLAAFRAIFDTSFFGNLHLAHAAWPQLLQRGYGRMVLTASSAALYANHGQSAYSAAKSAVVGLMRALALEGRRHGVLVNVIAPYGYSQMTAPYMPDRMARDFDPARVAPLVGWLCSEGCDVSGEVLVSGAGLVRRAGVGETDALVLPAGAPDAPPSSRDGPGTRDTGAIVHALHGQALRPYASANDSFARFVQELATWNKENPS